MHVSFANRTQAKVALIETGLWTAFKWTRDKHKIEGMDPGEAYQTAFNAFFPDGPGVDPVKPKECDGDMTRPGSFGTDSKPDPERAKRSLGKVTADDAPVESNDIGRLPDGALDGKSASRAEVVDWVAQNVATGRVDVTTCPSSEAWGMLRWVRRSVMNEGDFWKTIYRALLPTKSEIDATARFQDDGRNVFHAIDQMQKRLMAEESED